MTIDTLVVVTILGVATWKGLRTRHVMPAGTLPPVTSPVSADYDKRSLAMLYIEDLTPDGRFEVVATGLTSALIQQLRAARELRVASPSVSGMFRRHRAVGYDSTARQFGIGTLLSGSLSSLGTGVRVDLQILDALSGQVVARSRVDQEDHDWLRLQRSLADAVTGLLRQRLGAAARAIESHPGTSNPAAWEAMQHARRELLAIDSLVCLRAGPMTLARIARADSLLKLVSRMDDGWNEPVIERASLGDRAMQSGVAPGDTTPQHWVKLGLEHVARVLARSPDDLHAVRVRGTLRYWESIGSAEWPALLASADSDLSVAVKGDPGDAAGWNAWSGVLANRGQSSESRRALENAMRIDPLFPGLASTFTRLISVAIVQGWSSEATRWCDEGVRRFPDNYKFAECRLWLQGLPGARPDTSRLWATRDEYVRKSPAYLSQFSKLKGNILVGLALVRAGQPGPGKMLADAARGDSVVDPTRELTYLAAVVYVQAGDTVTSVRWLAGLVAADSSMRRVLEFRRRVWQLAPLAEVKRFRVLMGLRD
jgi:TolB-like protein